MWRSLVRLLRLAIVFFLTVLLTLFLSKILQIILSVYEREGVALTGENRYNPVAAGLKRVRSQETAESGRPESGHPNQGDLDFKHPRNFGPTKIDWIDYEYLATERGRTGIGEHGVGATVPAGQEQERKNQYAMNGFDSLLSDMISLNRSVKDTRHKEYEKHISVLVATIYYNYSLYILVVQVLNI